jgi:hypothetical protein
MHFEFEHLGMATPFELAEGQHLLGGSDRDQVKLSGLPPGFLTLRIEGSRLTVEAARPFTVNGLPVPPGVPRLVLPGEVVGLPEQMRLKVLQVPGRQERGVETAAVLKSLLTEGADVAASRAATLTFLTGLDVGRSFPLAETKTEIGRGLQVDLRVRDRAVSRAHAHIVREGSAFTLVDLRSPNGLYLNGHRVSSPEPLAEGDVIELGKTLLRFQAAVDEAPAPSPEPATPSEPLPTVEPAPHSRGKPRSVAWLIGLGVAAALSGVLVTYCLLG